MYSLKADEPLRLAWVKMLCITISFLCVFSKEIPVVMDATGSPGKQSALLTLLGQMSTVGVMFPVLAQTPALSLLVQPSQSY